MTTERTPPTDPVQGSIVEPRNPLPEILLEDLPEHLRAAAARVGWTALMPVQARAIPYLLARRDLMVQSRTGSGKTGAYLLPILALANPARAVCQTLVLVPTRELALQVAREAEMLCAPAGLRTVAVYGGVGYGPQLDAFRQGTHIVVGTPGRILDHLLKRSLSLEHLDILVFDEADRLLSMGFYPDMRQLRRYLPPRRCLGSMFSATFPGHVLHLAREFLHEPEWLSLSRDHVHVTDVDHAFCVVPGMDKDRCLVRLIEIENPAAAIIFCNTKARVHYVTVVLKRFGYDAAELSADISQEERERVLERLRKGKLRFLVATDVAARGLDIAELSHIILYEPPEEPEAYIHRAGRTGRAGAGGTAITLVRDIEALDLDRIAKRFSIDLKERPSPTDADVEAVVTQRLTALLEARLRTRDALQTERSRRFIPLARTLAENEDESAVIAMLLDDTYQQMLHAPLAQPPPETPGPSRRPPETRGARQGSSRSGGRRPRRR